MAYYAFLDSSNTVVEVIAGKHPGEDGIDWEKQYATIRHMPCKRTSYNTRGGIHYDPITNEPSADQSKAFRKNYAGIGYTYDETFDAFIPPKPYSSWLLNTASCLWEPPVPYPQNGKMYTWDETIQNWVLMPGVKLLGLD